jgi:hypothetical protein
VAVRRQAAEHKATSVAVSKVVVVVVLDASGSISIEIAPLGVRLLAALLGVALCCSTRSDEPRLGVLLADGMPKPSVSMHRVEMRLIKDCFGVPALTTLPRRVPVRLSAPPIPPVPGVGGCCFVSASAISCSAQRRTSVGGGSSKPKLSVYLVYECMSV